MLKAHHNNYLNWTIKTSGMKPLPNYYKESLIKSIRKMSRRQLFFDKSSQFNEEQKSMSFALTNTNIILKSKSFFFKKLNIS